MALHWPLPVMNSKFVASFVKDGIDEVQLGVVDSREKVVEEMVAKRRGCQDESPVALLVNVVGSVQLVKAPVRLRP